MAKVLGKNVCEVDYGNSNWMIEVGRCSRIVDKLVIRNFQLTSSSIGFLKSISAETYLLINSWDGDIVMERSSH